MLPHKDARKLSEAHVRAHTPPLPADEGFYN